jgi:hypothetical protein
MIHGLFTKVGGRRAINKAGHARRSPRLTNILLPIPGARRSHNSPAWPVLHGPIGSEDSHTGCTAPLTAQFHVISSEEGVGDRVPQACQTSCACETSWILTFERSTYRFSRDTRDSGGVGVGVEVSVGIDVESGEGSRESCSRRYVFGASGHV